MANKFIYLNSFEHTIFFKKKFLEEYSVYREIGFLTAHFIFTQIRISKMCNKISRSP
jgi:hypothetical protein